MPRQTTISSTTSGRTRGTNEKPIPPVAPCVVCHKRRLTMLAFQCVDGSIAWYCARHYLDEG